APRPGRPHPAVEPARRPRQEGRVMSRTTPCVVGINLGHDGGAALITDTVMVAIGEERLNRTRYNPGWHASLLYFLRSARLTPPAVSTRSRSQASPTPVLPALRPV